MEKLRISTLADIEAYERVPIEDRMTYFNTYDMLKQGAALDPEARAMSLILSGETFEQPMVVTYRDLLGNVTRTANLFHDLGIGPQDVVTYLLPNIPQAHYVLWGGEAAGIVNPINPMLEPGTIAEICQAAGTKVLVGLGEFPGSDIWTKIQAVRKELPGLEAVIRVMGPGDEKEGICGFEEVLDRYPGDRLVSGRRIDPEDVCSMYHTGGTTGTPKLAPHRHFNEAAMTTIMGLVADLHQGETIMCGLPLFHVNGTMVTGALPFSIGAHVLLLTPQGYRDPTVFQNFYRIVEHYRAVTFSSVPTILSVLLDIPKGEADISSLRYVVCGAAPLSVELFRRFEAHTGMKVMEGYGLTEGTTASSGNPYYGERRIGSIGLRGLYQEMRVYIVDEEGRFLREAEIDEIGSVCIKGPNVFKGYLEPAHNLGIWPQGPEAGWFNTGDLGRRDAEGYFWLTGRRKELIIRGGHNIDPAAIEEPLYRIPGVQVAAAVGRPDPHAGEVPVAFVQLQDGSGLTESDILERLKTEIGERAAIPKAVTILDEIPLTPIGKIFKPALRREAIRQIYQTEVDRLVGSVVESAQVTVKDDRTHGNLAHIAVKPVAGISDIELREKMDELLARYTVRYEIETT